MKQKITFILIITVFGLGIAQNIRTIQLKPVGSSKQLNVIPLGKSIELSFDDLDADSKEYQYKIEQMDYNWKLSSLSSSQYIDGFDESYISDISDSFNTLQNYTHYSVKIPNENTKITKTGNYLISVLDEDDELVFSKRCVFYKNKTLVGVSVVPSRISKSFNQNQNVQVIINHKNFKMNNARQEIKVAIFQNSNWKTTQYNHSPQSFRPNQLIYDYVNKNNFRGGNEFRNFDSKNLRNTSMNIVKTEMKEIHHNYLYGDEPRNKIPYSYNPDANGQFVIRTLESDNHDSEADYAMMHFSLVTPEFEKKQIYIVGQFNDYELSDENKMIYNNDVYEVKLKLKQGFYNYQYVVTEKDKNGDLLVDNSLIDGSFYQTDNEYTVLVYFRPIGGQYDRVIGVGRGYVKN